MNGHAEEDVSASCEHVFDQFITAVTCKSILSSFQQLLDLTGLRHADHSHFYERLKAKLKGSWKAQSLWVKLDKRASHRDYKKGEACSNLRVLIIGSGPCGLRTAIECALLGAKTVIVEKRDRFSRNNVLHLWPYLITDLRNLGAKKFFGKFCAGSIDHISIRQLQCILLKVALLLGVEVHVNVTFEGLVEPPEDQSSGIGWRCRVTPENHALSEYQFDVLIGADGKRNTLPGFRRKEFRGKLAIAVTANFINRNTQAEARVQEISGVAFIFNQKFFMDLKESTRIDLENIVYYKDDTHYFVMTAKKASLLEKGVLKEDYSDTVALLDRSNVNQDALMEYAREAADFSTNYQLPSLDYAVNHYGQADVAMFDFTSMFAAENASRFILKNGHHLLTGLVGDTLLEPFWPTGSGCARGFLGAFDAAWMIHNWAMGKTPLQVLAERESIYTILSQTTPNYLNKNHNMFSIDPNTRYPNLNLKVVKASQVRHLYEGGVFEAKDLEEEDLAAAVPAKKARNTDISSIDSYTLLRWCQRVLNTGKYRDVHVVDFTSSWRSGLALCALIHSFRPDIINNTLLMECDVAANNQMAFSVAEKELGIPPVLTGEDMAKYEVPDKLTMISYLTQFYDLFKHEPLPSTMPLPVKAKRKSLSREAKQPKSPNKRASFFQKLSAKLAKSNKRKEKEENEQNIIGTKKLKEKEKDTVELTRYNKLPMDEIANRLQLDRRTDIKVSKTEEMSGAVSVTAMADLLVAKFKNNESKPPPEPIRRMKGQPSLLAASAASEFCSFCHKRVYIMERMSAEGEFFHRGCLKCDHCGVGLRLTNYSCDRDTKPVKFYCYRHAIPELRTRPQRKRGLEQEELVPDVVVTPPPDVDTGQAPKEKSPRKAASVNLTPLLLPKEVPERPKNTPERVEFEISFDGQEEESEEEQFEHNLRASLSSDTLLDDDDDESDSELSDSDLESGAEDEIWENAVGSPTPLTLEQACELRGTWIRQHSQENLVEAVEEYRTRSRGPVYSRLPGDNMEEDESSTEVEKDSEYETDDSSDEEDSEEDDTEPAVGASAEEHTEKSLKSPVSPVSRMSASKASFFSEPPKVVSLDPWSMFGMGKKEAEKETTEAVAEVKVARKKSSASDKKKSSASESRSVSERRKSSDSKKDLSSKDTDVSESLEFDIRSADAFVDRSDHMSPAESLDELKEDLNLDVVKDVKEVQLSQDMDVVEEDERMEEDVPQNLIKSAEEISDLDQEIEKESEGDDELLEADDEEELMEKKTVRQPLKDTDHNTLSKDSASDHMLIKSSNSEKSDIPTEGGLISRAGRTKKLRMKRHRKNSKEQRMSNSTDSDAGRTDPTTTDNSQPYSSVSHSPSAELSDISLQEVRGSDKSQNSPVAEGNDQKLDETAVTEDQGTAENLKDGAETDDDGFQKVLESVAAMPDLSDNSDIDDIVLRNVDDRFVTSRHRQPGKKMSSKLRAQGNKKSDKIISDFNQEEDAQMNFSFSLPSSSDSESLNSAEADKCAAQMLEVEPGDDDIKPDQGMLRDYTTTMSLALGESYSDEAEDKLEEKEAAVLDKVSIGDKTMPEAELDDMYSSRGEQIATGEAIESADQGSFYLTPDASLEKQENDTLISTPTSALLGWSLPQPHLQSPEGEKSVRTDSVQESFIDNNKVTPSVLAPPDEGGNRDSTGSDIFLSPAESNAEPQFVNKPSSSISLEVSSSSGVTQTTSQSANVMPSKASQNKTKVSVTRQPLKSTPVSSDSMAGKSLRKLPELPKLNIPKKEHLQPFKRDGTVDQPVMCSSPKIGSKLNTKSSEQNLNQRNRPLPVPKTNSKGSTNKSSSSVTTGAGKSSNSVTTATSKSSSSVTTATSKSSNSVTTATSKSSNSVTTATSKSSSSVTTAISKSSTSASQKAKSAKPSSAPVFKAPPPKTKVPIDKIRLQLGSSSDRPESDHEMEVKKKISAEGIVINGTFDDDIPFADESEAEEKFYTPSAPEKREQPTFPAAATEQDARKKILPASTSVQDTDTVAASTQQTKDTCKPEISRPKVQTEEKAKVKADEKVQTVATVNPLSNKPTSVQNRQSSVKMVDSHTRHSASYDTNSTSDVLSDSDDKEVQIATSSATEGDQSVAQSKKTKMKAHKTKQTKEKKPENKDTKKSLLALIRPVKTGLSSDKTEKETDYNSNIGNKVLKTKKTENSMKPVKAVFDDYTDKTPSSENKRELAICSVFHSEASNRQAKGMLAVGSPRRTIPLAPKASADEMSDSDESHISLSTMQKRREEDLDERVARRLRKIQQKQQKRAEQKRLRMAQEIQRQLEEVEVRQRELEERGIAVEKALRGDVPDGEDVDESQLMSEWFTLVHEKNALLRYESELIVRAKELELEDRQARLEMDFRERTKIPAKAGSAGLWHPKKETKTESDIVAEGQLLDELLDVVEQRNNLVAMLEEDRLREQKEDSDLKEVMAQKGFVLSPLSFDTRRTKIEAPLATLSL